MHPLLERQLRKNFPDAPPDDPRLQRLLRSIDAAYAETDEDRKQLERSLHLASDELYERNRRLEGELMERKRLEVELRLGEKLRAIGQLAAGVAHEINTPVQFIGDSLHFLREAFGDVLELLDRYEELRLCDDAPARDALGRAIEELIDRIELAYLREAIPRAVQRCGEGTERVATIVRALKTMAHPDTQEPKPADLNAAIENTLIVGASQYKYVANLELDLHGESSVLCHIGEIQQVLLNLIVNAAHAITERVGDSGQKGTIRIATYEQQGDFVVEVSDDGAGIPESARPRIFEPFFTTKPIGQGTGQGLCISRSLVVDRHGGQLTFQSTVGEGTTFTMRLPISGRPRLSLERVSLARLSARRLSEETR